MYYDMRGIVYEGGTYSSKEKLYLLLRDENAYDIRFELITNSNMTFHLVRFRHPNINGKFDLFLEKIKKEYFNWLVKLKDDRPFEVFIGSWLKKI